mmetsp:Transcript_26172/g.57949  ORF Transcript_26172/g.57949 Transcript_26172/m.57949 type:complete len:137 (+) Transcript_26172:449-859(+)
MFRQREPGALMHATVMHIFHLLFHSRMFVYLIVALAVIGKLVSAYVPVSNHHFTPKASPMSLIGKRLLPLEAKKKSPWAIDLFGRMGNVEVAVGKLEVAVGELRSDMKSDTKDMRRDMNVMFILTSLISLYAATKP